MSGPLDAEAVAWFRRPGPDDAGRLNAVFQLLDRRVVAGHADEPALVVDGSAISLARLLEDTAALGGVLRAQGVGPGTPVSWRAEAGRDGVAALLAVARVGGVVVADATVVIDDSGVGDAGWDVALRAGRTDPAPAADLAPDAPWTTEESVGSLAVRLAALALPATPADLGAALLAGT